MEYCDILCICEDLIVHEGYLKPGTRETVYIDPFGCDLQIHHFGRMMLGKKELKGGVVVFLGNRLVFDYDEKSNEINLMQEGYWRELIREIDFCRYFEEYGEENHTLVELCRKEAKQNCKILDECFKQCLAVVKKKGIKKKPGLYDFKFLADEGVVEIRLHENLKSHSNIFLYYNEELVFSFDWGGSLGSIFDDKGVYKFGKWKKILEELYKEL